MQSIWYFTNCVITGPQFLSIKASLGCGEPGPHLLLYQQSWEMIQVMLSLSTPESSRCSAASMPVLPAPITTYLGNLLTVTPMLTSPRAWPAWTNGLREQW